MNRNPVDFGETKLLRDMIVAYVGEFGVVRPRRGDGREYNKCRHCVVLGKYEVWRYM